MSNELTIWSQIRNALDARDQLPDDLALMTLAVLIYDGLTEAVGPARAARSFRRVIEGFDEREH